MARSRFNNITSDAINDGGTVLISLVQGEQIELPVNVEFIQNPALYKYEVALVEADNKADQTQPPVTIAADAVKASLTVRIPPFLGNWLSTAPYNTGDHVSYDGNVYERINIAVSAADPTTPDQSDNWILSSRGRLFIQIPSTVSQNYLQPTIGFPVYGFLELRVTETIGAFPKTLKPIRGVVEFLFSPTHITPDV